MKNGRSIEQKHAEEAEEKLRWEACVNGEKSDRRASVK